MDLTHNIGIDIGSPDNPIVGYKFKATHCRIWATNCEIYGNGNVIVGEMNKVFGESNEVSSGSWVAGPFIEDDMIKDADYLWEEFLEQENHYGAYVYNSPVLQTPEEHFIRTERIKARQNSVTNSITISSPIHPMQNAYKAASEPERVYEEWEFVPNPGAKPKLLDRLRIHIEGLILRAELSNLL